MDTAFAATLDVRTGTASPARLARMQPSTPSTPSTPASMTSMAPAGYVLEDILGCGGMAVVHRQRLGTAYPASA